MFKRAIFFGLLIMYVLFFFGCNHSKKQEKAKYVFYFIGDGMGLSHRALAEMYLASLNDEIGHQRLLMDSFPVQGLATTYSLSSYITCSAAAGTALATGHKTNVGMISFSPDSIKYQTIAEAARQAGMSVGILSNVMLNHATPAVFSAHQFKRSVMAEIRNDQLNSGFDFFAGGFPAITDTATSADKAVFSKQADEHNYIVSNSIKAVKGIMKNKQKYILVPDTSDFDGAMFYEIDRPKHATTLKQMLQKGIEELSENPNGFFIMLESGRIDWAAHQNDGATVIQEMIAFDEIIRTAFDFYQKHPDRTLIVITSDHETGGLTLGNSSSGYSMKPALLQYQKSSADMIGREYMTFRKTTTASSQSDVFYSFVNQHFGLGSEVILNGKDSIKLQEAWINDQTSERANSKKLVDVSKEILNQKAGLGWTTSKHTGTPVLVSAVGVSATDFDGYYDNTEISKKMFEIMGLQFFEK